MNSAKTQAAPARFNVGDRVRIRDLPNLFYTRTQMYVRGVTGTIAARTYEDLIPEDEAWNRGDAQPEQFYIVRFRQKDLWEAYPFDKDTLQTEFPTAGSSRLAIDRSKVGVQSMQQSHDHDHDDGAHDHPAAPMVDEITDFEILEIAVRELAIEKGLFTAEDHRKFTEWAESIGPAAGSRLVARAWTDPAFKDRVLSDAVAACREIGVDWTEPTGSGTPSDYMQLRVLEDTPTLHHVIVCTLCSCYPRPLLGHSPYWYRSPNYRRRLVRRPRHVLEEFGLIIPPEVEVRVEDSNQKCRFMVLPVRPAGTENWTEEQLAEIVTRDCMIGVALPRPDRKADDVRPVHKAGRPVPEHHQAEAGQ